MKLWLISQTENRDYDTYDSAIVAAETADEARTIHPEGKTSDWTGTYRTWARSPDAVGAVYIGEAKPEQNPGVILASFNAG